MSYGMSEGQKARTRLYLDQFKDKNGGCIICGRKVTDWFCVPELAGELMELRMYGSCAGHATHRDSDELLENAVNELLPKVGQIPVSNPTLTIVVFKDDGEDVKSARKE